MAIGCLPVPGITQYIFLILERILSSRYLQLTGSLLPVIGQGQILVQTLSIYVLDLLMALFIYGTLMIPRSWKHR